MSEKILVPVLGESITEATVSKWLKNEGEAVDADEPIVELETDKVNLEVPSPVTGKLIEINSKDGSTVKVGEILGLVNEIEGEIKESNEVKKIQPSNFKKNEELEEKDNVIKLDPIKEQAELDIFEETVYQLRRILKKDGLTSHEIDLKDHLSYSLNNLRFSKNLWESN